jgi:hypothetical protein
MPLMVPLPLLLLAGVCCCAWPLLPDRTLRSKPKPHVAYCPGAAVRCFAVPDLHREGALEQP